MYRQVIVTDWKGGQAPAHTYVDLGPGRAELRGDRRHREPAGGGVHMAGTKGPPSTDMLHGDLRTRS